MLSTANAYFECLIANVSSCLSENYEMHSHFFVGFLAQDRMSVASLCNHDLSVGSGGIVGVIIVVCEHSS